MRKIGMLDLKAEYKLFRDDIRAVVDEVLESQAFINGPSVVQLESEIANKVGAEFSVAVSSGTDALLATMMALEIGASHEVVLPAFTFFATAGTVARLGATPVFADIDPRTFMLDPDCVRAAISEKTRAILAVHLFGQCAEMDALRKIADEAGVALIEDAAQALGATYRGRPVGTFGNAACISFYPTKNLGGFGEGGMVLTNDAHLATVVRQLRNHGESERYVHEFVGGNFRLDTMKAAMLLVKMGRLDEFNKRRRENAARYDAMLEDTAATTPFVASDNEPVFHQYSILCDKRDELAGFLGERGVATGVYYPIPLHLQKCFSSLGYSKGSLPVSERICGEILSLPCHPMLAEEDIEYVGFCVREFYGVGRSASPKPSKMSRV